jgi:type I restriction enzyme R subunit
LIIDETPINPKYYEKMSELLDALIKERRAQALGYQEYLKKIVELTKRMKRPGDGGRYPKALDTPAKQALYDNLGEDEAIALAVHEAVTSTKQDGWTHNPIKTKMVRIAIKQVIPDEDKLDRTLELVKNQQEYA